MSTPQPDPVMTSIRALITDKRAALDHLEEALNAYQRAFGTMPEMTFEQPPTTEPRPKSGKRSGVRPAPARRASVPASADGSDLNIRVLAFLTRQSRPATMQQTATECAVRPDVLRKAVARLVELGQVVKTGVTAGTRIGIPRVMNAGEPAKEADQRADCSE